MPRKFINERTQNAVRHIVTPASVTCGTRVREPTKNYSGLFRGKFPSHKTQRMVHWESLLERDAIMLFEFSPGIATFREQPPSISYYLDNKIRKYTPDFELTYQSGHIELVEVKPWEKLQSEDEKKRFQAIQIRLSAHGQCLRFLSEREIRKQPLSENLHQLARHRIPRLLKDEIHRLEMKLQSVAQPIQADAVLALGSDRAFWQLVDFGKICIDLSEPIHSATPYTSSGNDSEKIYF